MTGCPTHAYIRVMPTAPVVTLGLLLREARLRAALSLKQAAPPVDVSYTHLSKIENGVTMPSVELLGRLLDLYQVSERDDFYTAAGTLPPDVQRVLTARPTAAYAALRLLSKR